MAMSSLVFVTNFVGKMSPKELWFFVFHDLTVAVTKIIEFNRDYALDFIRKEIRQNSSKARKFLSANAALAA